MSAVKQIVHQVLEALNGEQRHFHLYTNPLINNDSLTSLLGDKAKDVEFYRTIDIDSLLDDLADYHSGISC